MKRTVLAGLLMAGLTIGPAAAQNGPQHGMMGGDCPMMGMMGMMGQGGPGPGMMGGGGMGQGMGQGKMQGPADFGPMVEGRLAYLQSALNLTEAQQPAWQDYADAVRARTGVMQENHATMWPMMQAGTAPERMQARIAAMSAMLAALEALQPATEALYAALDEQQKAIADELIGTGCGAF